MGMNRHKASEEREIKCVIVGDGGVGKTSLLMSYTTGGIMMDYIPTCFDCYTVDMKVKDQNYTMSMIDTAGQETYDRLRTLAYYDTDVFVVCFSVADHDSFVNVKSKWIPEIRQYRPNTPFIIVGTQNDLRKMEADDMIAARVTPVDESESRQCCSMNSDGNNSMTSQSCSNKQLSSRCSNDQQVLTKECVPVGKGKSVAKKLGAGRYLECSALNGEGVTDVFKSALLTAFKTPTRKISIFKSLVSAFRRKKNNTDKAKND